MTKQFQNKKLNKDDHKEVKQAADGVKKILGVLGTVLIAIPAIKKYGKEIPRIAKDIIFRG